MTLLKLHNPSSPSTEPTSTTKRFVSAQSYPTLLKPLQPQLPGSKFCNFKRRECIELQEGVWFQIDSGVIRTTTWNEAGKVITLGFWGAGDTVSHSASNIDPYQIECLTDVTVCLMPQNAQTPKQAFVAQIEQMEKLLLIMHSGSIENRLLRFLMWMADKFGYETQEGWLIEPRLTHQDIADVIGTSRVTATRLFSKFQQDGIVRWSKQRNILFDYSSGYLYAKRILLEQGEDGN